MASIPLSKVREWKENQRSSWLWNRCVERDIRQTRVQSYMAIDFLLIAVIMRREK